MVKKYLLNLIMEKKPLSFIWLQQQRQVCKNVSFSLCLCNSNLNFFDNPGVVTSTVTNPIWVIKTRLQLQGKQRIYNSSFDCAKHILKQEGIKGFYKGMSASYLGVAEGTIQWVIYENLKKRWAHSPAQMEDKMMVGGKSAQGKRRDDRNEK